MARVQSTLVLNDQMSRVLARINKAMGLTLDSFEAMQRASGKAFDTKVIRAARQEIDAANASINDMAQSYKECNNQQQQLNKKQQQFNKILGQSSSSTDSLLGKIKNAAAVYFGVKAVKGLTGLSDTMTQNDARLSMMNDGSQTNAALKSMIFSSAERSRGSYLSTADSVAKLGLMAGDAFSSNKETIAFMEQVNKQFKIAGTSTQGIEAAMLQLTQAMGSGVLRGEEYNSILEQAPNIIQSIAKYMGVPKGQLKEMAAEGQITADIVKAAMFACADETNAKFESMPKTWSDIWTSLKNKALKALEPVLEKINKLANSKRVQRTVNSLLRIFSRMAVILGNIFDFACRIYNFISDNWSLIGPIIMGIVTALGAYKLAHSVLSTVLTIAAFKEEVLTAARSKQAVVTAGATGVQTSLNAAMWACPLTWIIALVLLLAVVFLLLWENCEGFREYFSKMWRDNMNVALRAYNDVIVPVTNWFLEAQSKVAVAVAGFARGCTNAYFDVAIAINDAIASILSKMSDLVTFYNRIATKLGAKPISIEAVANYSNTLEQIRQSHLNSIAGYEEKYRNPNQIKKWDENAFNTKADEWQEKIKDFTITGWLRGTKKEIEDGLNDDNEDNNGDDGYGDNSLDDIKDNTDDIADSVGITEEDLRYLRDLAEMEAINRFTTAEVKIDMTGMTNRIDSNMDLDGVITMFTDGFAEALEIAAEGVHS